MILKNLLRRKTRTLLTVIGIALGVSAIIGLGALADGLSAGYNNMLSGTTADLVVSQKDAFDISYSSLDEEIVDVIRTIPGVESVTPMIEGFTSSQTEPFLILFGYPQGSPLLEKYRVIAGAGIYDPTIKGRRGTPILLGKAAAEVMKKDVGDTIQLTGKTFRVNGIYETGDGFEDSAVLLQLRDAQEIMGNTRQVSIIYIDLKDPGYKDRFMDYVKRKGLDVQVSGTSDFANEQAMTQYAYGIVWVVGGLAILLGGITMMNSQLMSVYERTKEIGVLRALGWKKSRVMMMVLGESLAVCLIGGVVGTVIGWFLLLFVSKTTVMMGMTASNIRPSLLLQALVVVVTLGLIGGLYPAWKASRLQPVEALRYEGGSGGQTHRLPFGGVAIQSLWQRTNRTVLTMTVIAITVGVLIALEADIKGFSNSFTKALFSSQAEVIIRQSDIGDTSLSVIDERIGDRISVMEEVKSVSGWMFTALMLPEANTFFILQGLAPTEFAIQRYSITEGKPLTGNRQILLGKIIADSLKKEMGDTIELGGIRYRVVGIFESNMAWEQLGGIISLRDAQMFSGKPRKVTMYMVKLKDGYPVESFVAKLNGEIPGIHAAPTSEFVNSMPDIQSMDGMTAGITLLTIVVGGVGVLNTMLMSVMERTREIGVLRSLGWRRRQVLGLILREAVILGLGGAVLGIMLAFILAYGLANIPAIQSMLIPIWEPFVFVRALVIALSLGAIGGIYPAYRATRLLPTEALRYE